MRPPVVEAFSSSGATTPCQERGMGTGLQYNPPVTRKACAFIIGIRRSFLDFALSSYDSAALTRSTAAWEGLDGVIARRDYAGKFKVRPRNSGCGRIRIRCASFAAEVFLS